MWPPAVVKVQILSDRRAGLRYAGLGLEVELLVFDAFPDALDEDVVALGPFAVPADPDAVSAQEAGEGRAGELASIY
jgi:hypothetical protein